MSRIYILLEKCYNHSMNLRFMLTYCIDFCLALFGVLICARMVKTYRLKYLSYYLYFLITLNITGLYGDVPENLGLFIVSDSQLITRVGGILAALLGTPMILTAIYMFAHLITGMLDRKLGGSFKIGYFIFSGGIFMGQIILTANYFESRHEKLLMIFIGYSMKVFFSIFLMVIIYLFIKSGKISDSDQGRALRIFGILYIAIFLYALAFTLGIKPVSYLPQSLFLFILFALQLLPLLYWKRFLKRRQAEFIPSGAGGSGEEWNDLAPFLSGNNISPRETEIIRLLLKGKSNKEIEDELFISVHTVRNHVYNIYQKLGVKNRVELVNLIRNSTD